MVSSTERSLFLPDPASTERLASTLAPRLRGGDCLLLSGPVGAGKSTLARALIRALLPIPEDIPSPTFTLVQTYATADFEIWHCDLYRLSNSDELVELGLEEAFEEALTIIEWPDRLGDFVPENAQNLRLEMNEDGKSRVLHVCGDSRWDTLIPALA